MSGFEVKKQGRLLRYVLVAPGIVTCAAAVLLFFYAHWMQAWSTLPRYQEGFAFSEQHPVRYRALLSGSLASALSSVASFFAAAFCRFDAFPEEATQ